MFFDGGGISMKPTFEPMNQMKKSVMCRKDRRTQGRCQQTIGVGDIGSFYERLLSPALSSIHRNGREGAKGSPRLLVFEHRHATLAWFVDGGMIMEKSCKSHDPGNNVFTLQVVRVPPHPGPLPWGEGEWSADVRCDRHEQMVGCPHAIATTEASPCPNIVPPAQLDCLMAIM